MDLKTDLGFIRLKCPLLGASGTFGYGVEFQPFFDLDLCGAIILKGVYKNSRPGNPPPRIWETYGGLLNSVGLPGPGMHGVLPAIRELRKATSAPIVINVCGEDDDEFLEVASFFDDEPDVSFLELNISCPNVKSGGRCPAQDSEHTYRLVKRIKGEVKKGLMVKLTPNTDRITEVALAAQEAGADSLALVNTFLATAVDLEARRFVFKNIYAGYSGPAIKPLAQRIFWQVAKAVSIPLVAIGGICSGKDVLEYVLLGARAAQIGTMNLSDPSAIRRILEEIRELMQKMGINSLDEIRGKVKC